jgi:hypothetical protein
VTTSNPSRRSLVTTAATLPALAIPTVALTSTEVDPIFAAIEAHRRAWTENERECSKLDEATHAGDDQAKRRGRQLLEAVDATADALVDILPTTLAGVAALLEYAGDHAIDRGDRWPGEYVVEDESGQRHVVFWETALHVNLVEALSKIAA